MDYNQESDDGAGTAQDNRLRSKVHKSMTDEDVLKLIKLVQPNECIWNTADANYANKLARNTAWSSVAHEFGGKFEEDHLRGKWNNLRIQFRINATRHRSRAAHGVESTVHWRFFKHMSFIAPDRTATPVVSLFAEESLDYDSGSTATSSTKVAVKRRASTPLGFVDVNSYDASKFSERDQQGSRLSTPSTTIVDSLRGSIDPFHCQSNDTNLAFTKYIYTELNQLPEDQAKRLRMQIMHSIMNFNVTELNRSNK